MSWMDSWSRPATNSKLPPAPYYLSDPHTPYCRACGRLMPLRKASKKLNAPNAGTVTKDDSENVVKYCSNRCRARRPTSALDRRIERAIVALLDAEPNSGLDGTGAADRTVKGDKRVVVTCDEIEEVVFGSRFDPEKVYGRRRNRRRRGIENGEWRSVDMESSMSEEDTSDRTAQGDKEDRQGPCTPEGDEEGAVSDTHKHTMENVSDRVVSAEDHGAPYQGGVHIRPPQHQSEVNFSVGGERGRLEKISETPDDMEKRRQGARRAAEREMVRCAVRRGIVFGFEVSRRIGDGGQGRSREDVQHTEAKSRKKRRADVEDVHAEVSRQADTELRKAEAIMNGIVVEPSFAKGNWSTRWRE